MMTQKAGTWGHIIDCLFAIALYGGLTYVTWSSSYWILTILFSPLTFLQVIGLTMDFSKTCSETEPLSPWASPAERLAWEQRERLHRQQRHSQHSNHFRPSSFSPSSLTWTQLERYHGLGSTVVHGKTLEVIIFKDHSLIRHSWLCADRVGDVRRIEAYTKNGMIPGGATIGSKLRWKHPRLHYFMDGSSGAIIEENDLRNITIW